MLRSLNQLYGKTLGTADGDAGHVKDFYFDVRKWAVPLGNTCHTVGNANL